MAMKSKRKPARKVPVEHAAGKMSEAEWARIEDKGRERPPFPSTLSEFRELAAGLAKLGLLVKRSDLTETGPVEIYGPSSEFLEAFNGHCRDTVEQFSRKGAPEMAWFGAIMATVHFWQKSSRDADEIGRILALGTKYALVMAVYMHRAGIHKQLGIAGVCLFPGSFHGRVKEWLGWGRSTGPGGVSSR
jgi:hypothetical protein